MSGKLMQQCSVGFCRKTTGELPLLGPGKGEKGFNEVQNFLKRFGYIPMAAPIEPGMLCPHTGDGLKAFQRRYKLNETGKFDGPTKELINRSRCGVPDFSSELDFRTIAAWDRRSLTFAFGAPTQQPVGPDAASDAVRSAFATMVLAGVGLALTEIPAEESPDILVEWRRAADPDHSMIGGTLAHADFPPGSSIITDGLPLPLHFDDDEHRWVVGTELDGFDIETVALHEIGHNLGLLHTYVSGTVMFPSVSPNFTRHDLQPDDMAGLRELYPQEQAS